MNSIKLNTEEAKNLIKKCFYNRTLIPIIGAGFSKECKTDKASVPDAKMFKELMIEKILENSEDFIDQKERLLERSFQEISEIFLNGKYVKREIVKNVIGDYFLNVKLSKEKIDFLSLSWPYIYTLNIDDAIEGNSHFKTVLPYKRLSQASRTIRCVYKLHGDATHEHLYEENSSLIFSSSQYVRSLIKNESMLSFLQNDLFENNLIFIGCSLKNEIDLLYAIAGLDEKPIRESSRIYITKSEPDVFDKVKLENYEINTVIIVDDYDSFYSEINKMLRPLETKIDESFTEFSAENIVTLPKDKDQNLNYLLNADSALIKNRHYTMPYYLIERSLKRKVIKSITDFPITIIKGRRFSGKTLFIQDIAKSIRNRDVFYVSIHGGSPSVAI